MNTPKENRSKRTNIPAFDSETLGFVERTSAIGFSLKHITYLVLETFPYYGFNDSITDEEIQIVITKRIHKARTDKQRASYNRIQMYKKEFEEIVNIEPAVNPLPLLIELIELEKQRIEIKLSGNKDFNNMMKILNEARKTQQLMEQMLTADTDFTGNSMFTRSPTSQDH